MEKYLILILNFNKLMLSLAYNICYVYFPHIASTILPLIHASRSEAISCNILKYYHTTIMFNTDSH